MTLDSLLDQIRNGYLAQFSKSLEVSRKSDKKVIAEGAYRDQNGALVREGALELALRGDFFTLTDGQSPESFRVDSEALVEFVPISFELPNGASLHLAPFYWDGCNIQASVAPSIPDWSQLRAWFEKWFDGDDTHEPNAQGLSEVLHFMSDPIIKNGSAIFQVDFGSAPIEAFKELLDTLHKTGFTSIKVGHS